MIVVTSMRAGAGRTLSPARRGLPFSRTALASIGGRASVECRLAPQVAEPPQTRASQAAKASLHPWSRRRYKLSHARGRCAKTTPSSPTPMEPRTPSPTPQQPAPAALCSAVTPSGTSVAQKITRSVPGPERRLRRRHCLRPSSSHSPPARCPPSLTRQNTGASRKARGRPDRWRQAVRSSGRRWPSPAPAAEGAAAPPPSPVQHPRRVSTSGVLTVEPRPRPRAGGQARPAAPHRTGRGPQAVPGEQITPRPRRTTPAQCVGRATIRAAQTKAGWQSSMKMTEHDDDHHNGDYRSAVP